MEKKLALHETLELSELLTFKTLCLTKSATFVTFVQDDALKSIMLDDVQKGQDALESLGKIVTRREIL